MRGAEFTAYNQSDNVVMIGNSKVSRGEAAVTIKTDKNGLAKSSADALPYGHYLIKETKAPAGYLLDDKWSRVISIRKNGEVIDTTSELKNSLERIRKTADEMISSIDRSMEKQREKSEKEIENER